MAGAVGEGIASGVKVALGVTMFVVIWVDADRQCMSDQRMSNGTDRACLTRTGVAADSPGRSMSVTVSQMDRASA